MDGVDGEDQCVGDPAGGAVLEHEADDLLLARGQAVCRHQERKDPGRVGRFDDDRDPPFCARHERRAVEHDPGSSPGEHPLILRRPLLTA
jgi:hypothetical protein